MSLENWEDVIDRDWPDQGPVTSETVRAIQYHAQRYGGTMREATGRVWTNEAYEARRKKVLSTPLP
ncbi:hypothetical protein J4429_00720 [Candidatus Pacearchaeota archaeon]|nr:hypothetical protein [Candidatus Pacearchaeota archaeon]